jgi:Flp pilus assembly protein TadG
MRRLKPAKRRGASMVEMALILPLLVLLIFALMEYGWMFLRVSQVHGAARHGARAAARPDATQAEVESAVAAIMTQAGMGSKPYTVQITDLDAEVTQPVTVRVSLNYDDIALTGFALLPVPDEINGQTTMAKEGP